MVALSLDPSKPASSSTCHPPSRHLMHDMPPQLMPTSYPMRPTPPTSRSTRRTYRNRTSRTTTHHPAPRRIARLHLSHASPAAPSPRLAMVCPVSHLGTAAPPAPRLPVAPQPPPPQSSYSSSSSSVTPETLGMMRTPLSIILSASASTDHPRQHRLVLVRAPFALLCAALEEAYTSGSAASESSPSSPSHRQTDRQTCRVVYETVLADFN